MRSRLSAAGMCAAHLVGACREGRPVCVCARACACELERALVRWVLVCGKVLVGVDRSCKRGMTIRELVNGKC